VGGKNLTEAHNLRQLGAIPGLRYQLLLVIKYKAIQPVNVVVTYSDGINQTFMMNPDDELKVHGDHKIKEI